MDLRAADAPQEYSISEYEEMFERLKAFNEKKRPPAPTQPDVRKPATEGGLLP